MDRLKAEQFWLRYEHFGIKDLPITLITNIHQSTLSTWKHRCIFPRADVACKIAKALNTTVEYLVYGQEDMVNSTCTSAALEVAIIADQLDKEGFRILKDMAYSLKLLYPKK